jgi:hypothetical protein
VDSSSALRWYNRRTQVAPKSDRLLDNGHGEEGGIEKPVGIRLHADCELSRLAVNLDAAITAAAKAAQEA